MKVVAFDGGAYRQGPVGVRLQLLLGALAAEGAETELLWLEKDRRTGCYMCGQCGHRTGAISCSRPSEDGLRRCVRKLKAADAVVVGTPVYTLRPSPATQELLNRLGHDRVERGDRRLEGKPAAIVVDPRSDGAAVVTAALTERLTGLGLVVVRAEEPVQATGADDGAGDPAAAMGALARVLAGAVARGRA